MNQDQINELNRTIDGITDEVRIAGEHLQVELMYDIDDPSEFWGLVSDFINPYMFAYTINQITNIKTEVIQERVENCWAMRCLDPDCMADLERMLDETFQELEPHYHFSKESERGAEPCWHADLVNVLPFSAA